MTKTSAWEPFGAAATESDGSIDLRETASGFSVIERPKRFDTDATLELVLRFAGLAMMVAAAGQWFLPGTVLGENLAPAKFGLSMVLALTGFVFYWLAARGLKTQMLVDTKKRRIHLVYLNSRGKTRPQKIFTMRDLESFYVKRTKNPLEPASLYLRLRGASDLKVAVGSEAELSALHERMCRDLQPARRRLAKRQARDLAQASVFKAA